MTKSLSIKFFILAAFAGILSGSCDKEPGIDPDGPGGIDPPKKETPETIAIDLNFRNDARVNPLGFDSSARLPESSDGETYEFDGFPITLCKGNKNGGYYSYSSDGCLVFEKGAGWMELPAITGWQLQSVTYEHVNTSVKQMAVKTSLNPSVTIAYSSSDSHFSASSDAPASETLAFYRDGKMSVSVSGEPGVNAPTYLQFVSDGTKISRIKAVYMRELPGVPQPEGENFGFPRVAINTAGSAPIVSKEDYLEGSFEYSDPDGVNPGEKFVSETDVARFRGRGNTSWNRFAKKPYKIKLNGKVSLFGLSKDKEWALIASHNDKSLLRNLVAMKLSSILGFDWTPAMYPVELWLNGRYDGVYFLSEHKKISSSRINIKTPEDGGNGMYLEFDLLMDETTCFKTDRFEIPVMFSDPEIPSVEMLDETKKWLNDFETALASDYFADPLAGYSAYIDVPSTINHYIIQELSKNVDGRLTKGAFITRETGGPIKFYHEWDFDIAFGNNYAISTLPGVDAGPTGFMIKDFTGGKKNSGWYPTLFRDPAFVRAVKTRWNEVYPNLLAVKDYIDDMAAVLKPAAERNFVRWPVLGAYLWPNVIWPKTYDEEVSYLKAFYSERLEWLNANLNALPE